MRVRVRCTWCGGHSIATTTPSTVCPHCNARFDVATSLDPEEVAEPVEDPQEAPQEGPASWLWTVVIALSLGAPIGAFGSWILLDATAWEAGLLGLTLGGSALLLARAAFDAK